MRIVFATDSHLNKHYARMSPEQLSERRARLRAAWAATVEFAIHERVDLYVHGGDLFDGPNPRAAELTLAARQFQRLREAGIPALLLGGNHDIPKTRLGGAAPQDLLSAVHLAHVFTGARGGGPTASERWTGGAPARTGVEWWVGEANGLRVAVGGLAPDPTLAPGVDPLAGLAVTPPQSDVAILVVHHAIEGTEHPASSEPVIRRATLGDLDGRVRLVLAGHIHRRHDFFVNGVRVVLPGPTERTSFGELRVRPGFLDIEIDADDLRIHHRPVASQAMRREVVRGDALPADEPTEWLLRRIEAWSDPDQILQLRLAGAVTRSVYHATRFFDVLRRGAEINFYFDLDRHGLAIAREVLDAPAPASRASPRDEIRRVAEGMARASDTDQERALLLEACGLALGRYGHPNLHDDA